MSRQSFWFRRSCLVLLCLVGMTLACHGKKARGPATPAPSPEATERPSPPPIEPSSPSGTEVVEPEETVPPVEDSGDILARSLEDLNAQSPLTDIRFEYDSAALTAEARSSLEAHARWLLRYPSVTILIEGHCDERGTVEYNLALGERRAMAAHNYLESLGVTTTRMKTISYGKEFPLDPGHDEAAWALNRRGHFLITSK